MKILNNHSLKALYGLLFSLSIVITACNNDDDEGSGEPSPKSKISDLEGETARLAAAEEGSEKLHFLNMKSGNWSNYTLASDDFSLNKYKKNRYLGIVHRDLGKTEFFDSGIEDHGDHGDETDSEGLMEFVLNSDEPTHFKYKNNRIAIFNDGDGSVSVIDPDKLDFSSYSPTTIDVGVAHHGAAVAFEDGKVSSTTMKESGELLPVQVALFDENGDQLAISDSVGTIHGQAGAGDAAFLGNPNGVAVMDKDGNSRLIPNIDPLSEERGSWLGTLWDHPNQNYIYGQAGSHGIFKVDYAQDTIHHIINNDQISAVEMDERGDYIFVLQEDGQLIQYSASSGSKVTDIQSFAEPSEGPAPSLSVARSHAFVSNPAEKSIVAYKISNLQTQKTIDLDFIPRDFEVMGFFE